MGNEYELGAQRKKRMVTTYGRLAKKRQPKTVFTPLTASDSMSEDDPIAAASDGAMTSRQPPPAPSPKHKSPSVRFKELDGTCDKQAMPVASQNITNSDRKRKVSQIYKPRELSRSGAHELEEEDPTTAPAPRRSRITQPESRSAAKPGGRERTFIQQRASSNSMDAGPSKPRISSPPPTPTPPRISKLMNKSSSSHVARQKSTNALPVKKTERQLAPEQRQIPLHLARDPAILPKLSNLPTEAPTEQTRSKHTERASGSRVVKKRRKRLIDVLVEQEINDTTALGEDITNTQGTSSQTIFSQSSNISELDNESPPETPKHKVRTAPTVGIRTFARSSSALKFTYGQGRKVLEEEDDLLESLVLPGETSYPRRRLDLDGPKKSASVAGAFDYDNDDGATNNSPGSKLRDIHELRQAGANSRVADAMQDLIDQIKEPGTDFLSSRRAALLQVAEKMRDKNFIRQCRDHGVESIMLKGISKETDTICGYLILSSLVTIIASRVSTPISQLLCTEEAGPIFARLLNISEDIKKVAKDRGSNLSKRSQSSISTIESLLQGLPIWDGDRPTFISPRNLAIKCLQLLIAQDVHISRDPAIFTGAVTRHLFGVLSDATDNPEYWDYPKTARSIELCGTLFVLDAHAASVAATEGSSAWAIPYLCTMANAFYISLQTPTRDSKMLDNLILKLTINMTNNNHAAPNAFASKEPLLAALATSISDQFNHALTLISQDTWIDGILDSLVLRLGILINFAEHSELVRQMVNDYQHGNGEPVRELIQLFNENHRRTGEADSMEKTHLNVAFGYLSVLLGYLALHEPVEDAMTDGDDDDHHRGGYAERLQELVQQLEGGAARR
ncbi:putative rheb small monomeric gtpase protein [Rosellinia necatrix]|uniref:Putative rheb small monomeric gtpase protein n=1 Tax=Rosellinia necatrix TaxID=77044 RepID=A0A1W2THP1_ROSNE|nr:putative rheb small monomeric gtpase protein [Rosellinia necatrix]